MRTPLPLAFGALLAAVTLSACAAPAEPDAATTPSAKPSASQPSAPMATTEPADDETSVPSDVPACDTIITEGTVEGLTSQGWTAKQEEFRIGDILIEGGLLCLWSDYSAPSDHGQMYGWGPIDAETADAARDALIAEGWISASEGDRNLVTEDPSAAFNPDDEGFGMTYEFGDGWVKLADTKQSLVLIDWEQQG